MKLRRPIAGFKPSVCSKERSRSNWDFDSPAFSTVAYPSAVTTGGGKASYENCEKSISRPSGKGRFGKRALSFTIDYGGYSNDSNSNDSGVGCDLNSSESQLSWCSEDSRQGRPASISPSTGCLDIAQSSNQSQTDFYEESFQERPVFNGSSKTIPEVIQRPKSPLVTQQGQIIEDPSTMSPESALHQTHAVSVKQSHQNEDTYSRNNSLSTSNTVPLKRARFSYPQQVLSSLTKASGLKLRNQNGRNNLGKRLPPGTAPTLTSPLSSVSRDGRAHLQIVAQPEEQHRARYQTEGSRGAIKDRKGNGFPTVRLVGYDKPATLQIFIGTDQGKVSPHMFYQACKVTGKSSTPCIEKKIEGTALIEIEFEPSKDMVISCDCVGILKERNVDVEQRFPFHHASQSRKKSTKCRMIFRATILNENGIEETLQVSSVPILCTQPPGLPEICKQSLFECQVKGGMELFFIGKNFLKDTKVSFMEEDHEGRTVWEYTSEPLKDYLQQNHLICPIPPYRDQNIVQPVECKVIIVSGGKQSEPHRFTYLPNLSIARYGITSCITQSTSNQGVILEPVLGQQTNQKYPVDTGSSMDLQAFVQLSPTNTGGLSGVPSQSATEAITSAMGVQSSSMCQQQQLIQSSPQLNSIPTISFPGSMLPPASVEASVQQRQVVSELQSILEQSSQQNHHEKSLVQMIESTNLISERNSSPFSTVDVNASIGHHSPVGVSPSVPLDLQFPTDNLPTQQAIASSTFSSPPATTCMSSEGFSQLLNTTSNVGMNVDEKMLQDFIPKVESVTSSNSFDPRTSSMLSSVNSGLPGGIVPLNQMVTSGSNACSIGLSGSVATCIDQNLVKVESPIGVQNVGTLSIENLAVVAATPNNGIIAGSNGNFIGGDLQPHQGSIANALTQMSDNELINYINPSCFEQHMI